MNVSVYGYYQLLKDGNKFSRENKKWLKDCKLPDGVEHLERMNESWETTGKLYILDEVKTKAMQESMMAKQEPAKRGRKPKEEIQEVESDQNEENKA